MKKLIFFSLITLWYQCIEAQSVSINNNGASPDASAMLDVASQVKGILIPRMDASRRTNIDAPAEGLLVFDTDSRTFWYYSQSSWKEIPNTITGAPPTGTALGDLYGNYPAPSVGKIQNLDVAFGVPFDKQALKWDMLNNRWQGQNDSLFLPYNVTFGSPNNLFSITNANTALGSTAIYGKSSNAGSGITSPASTAGVWGDNSTGSGVYGTSFNGNGVLGFSTNGIGVRGEGFFSGVYGTKSLSSGYAVMGEISDNGISMYGKSTGLLGKAAWFENIHTSNTDTVAKFIHKGLGVNSYLINNNSNNTGSLIKGEHNGNGSGIQMSLTNINNTNPLMFLEHYGKGSGIQLSLQNSQNTSDGIGLYKAGTGTALHVTTDKSKAAEFYSNVLNTDTAVYIRHDGSGKGLLLNLNKITNSSTAFTTLTKGTGGAGSFEIDNASNNIAALTVHTNGTGEAINAVKTSTASNIPAINGTSLGTTGIAGYGNQFGVFGFSTGNNLGTGVLGQAAVNDPDGTGVKGIAYSNSAIKGGVVGTNTGQGPGVFSESTDGAGIRCRTYGDGRYSLIAEAGFSNSQSSAALFTNAYALSTTTVVAVENSGSGNEFNIRSLKTTKSNPVINIVNFGTGKFLSFDDETNNEKFSVAKTGNVNTDGAITASGYILTSGTMTVKGDKGIVRNSTSTQMRMQELTVSVPALAFTKFEDFGNSHVITMSFTPAFSSPPVVCLGNIITDGGISNLSISLRAVTASGFELRIVNHTNQNFGINPSSVKVMLIGAE